MSKSRASRAKVVWPLCRRLTGGGRGSDRRSVCPADHCDVAVTVPRAGTSGLCHDSRAAGLAQGLSAVLRGLVVSLLLCLGAAGAAVAASRCDPQDLPGLQALAPGLWWLPGLGTDADADNRGQVSNLLLARDGPRLWALGAGPTAAFGARLRCLAQRRIGRPVTDLVSPWAHPELVLGARGLAPQRHWAHMQVATAMRASCERCSARLREQLGAAGNDVGDQPPQLPQRLLHGTQGRLGPFDWWALPRGDGQWLTLWRHRRSGVIAAPGLAWGDGPPDLRDADAWLLAASLQQARALLPAGARWIGEQGPPLDEAALDAQARYLGRLQQAAEAAAASAQLLPPAPALDDPASTPAALRRHQLNWQRALRQAEDRSMR